MKYKKGTKLKVGKEFVYYMDEFHDEHLNKLILVCGGLGSNFSYIPEDEAKPVRTSYKDKTIDVLVDVATTMKNLNENIENMQEMFMGQECDCDDCDEECDDAPTSANLN